MLSKNTKSGFTIVELMVAIIIFTLGLLGAYALTSSANSLSLRSKDEIIIGNILRERIELVKNMRDGNWMRSKNWNAIDTNAVNSSAISLDAGYYVIENDFQNTDRPTRIEKLSYAHIGENEIKQELAALSGNPTKMRLCIDEKGRYTHNCENPQSRKTPFFAFVEINQRSVTESSGEEVLSGALAAHAYVYATDAGIRLYDMHTLITDWKK